MRHLAITGCLLAVSVAACVSAPDPPLPGAYCGTWRVEAWANRPGYPSCGAADAWQAGRPGRFTATIQGDSAEQRVMAIALDYAGAPGAPSVLDLSVFCPIGIESTVCFGDAWTGTWDEADTKVQLEVNNPAVMWEARDARLSVLRILRRFEGAAVLPTSTCADFLFLEQGPSCPP